MATLESLYQQLNLEPPEEFFEKKLAWNSKKLMPKELMRQTGKTTNKLLEACLRSLMGQQVIYVVHNYSAIKYASVRCSEMLERLKQIYCPDLQKVATILFAFDHEASFIQDHSSENSIVIFDLD